MKIILILFLACLAIVLTVLLITSVKVEIYGEKNELNGEFSVWIKYLFIKKCITKPTKKKKKKNSENGEEQNNSLSDWKKKLKKGKLLFDNLKNDVIEILKFCTDRMITIQNFDIDVIFGLDDPMETGILNGLMYGFIYNILGVVHNYSHIQECNVNIKPDFNNQCYNVKVNCILRLKNVHITVIIVKLVKIYKKIKKLTKERK